MKKLLFSVLALGTVALFTGCSSKIAQYSVSTENVKQLQFLSANVGKVNLGKFSDSNRNETSTLCRLSISIKTADDETFSEYIKNALEKELSLSGIYDANAKTTISLNLDETNAGSNLGNAYWEFKTTVTSSNGKSIKVNSKYDYESSFTALAACGEMQRTFSPAVQKLNGAIISHSEFSSLLK